MRTMKDMFSRHKLSVGLSNASQKARQDMPKASPTGVQRQQAYPEAKLFQDFSTTGISILHDLEAGARLYSVLR